MIEGHIYPTADGEMIICFKGPASFFKMPQPVKIANTSEGQRLVDLYNRVLISATLQRWAECRYNVFNHVGDMARAKEALRFLDVVNDHRRLTLGKLCLVMADHAGMVQQIAPGSKSRFYGTYQKYIVPVMNYCSSWGEMRKAS